MLVQAQLVKAPATVMYAPVASAKTADGIATASSLHTFNGTFVTTTGNFF